MSKSISEDSEGKRASATEFGVRQLFRRPAPTSESIIKSFKATYTTSPQVVTSGAASILWNTAGETNRNPECFQHEHDASSGTEWDVLRILEDGVYTVMVRVDAGTALAYGAVNMAMALFRYDDVTLSSKTWPYNSTQGYADLHYTWTFEMDGTAGSNRKFAIHIINFHTAIAGTNDNLNLDALTLGVYKWPGTISL